MIMHMHACKRTLLHVLTAMHSLASTHDCLLTDLFPCHHAHPCLHSHDTTPPRLSQPPLHSPVMGWLACFLQLTCADIESMAGYANGLLMLRCCEQVQWTSASPVIATRTHTHTLTRKLVKMMAGTEKDMSNYTPDMSLDTG